MNHNTTFYEEYLEKVNGFGQINWVKNYLALKEKPNFWTILEYGKVVDSRQKSAHEIRYSKMFRWLFDANENHNLGNLFAHKLLQEIDSKITYPYSPAKNSAIKCTSESQDDIDIFYKDRDQKICFAIELKQFAAEHESTGYDSQLDKYEEAVKKVITKTDPEIIPYYIFLTPTKDAPSNSNWHALGYKEMIALIEEVQQDYIADSNEIYKEDTQKILKDFKEDLQRSVDLLEKDASYIMENFTKEERDFTMLLARELREEIGSKEIDRLFELNDEQNPYLDELILLISEYSYIQDHTPNDGVGILMRKVYNYIAEGPSLDLNPDGRYPKAKRTSAIKPALIEHYQFRFDTVQLTQGKGQGIYLENKELDRRLYFSGDTDGHVPNDHLSILKSVEQNKKHIVSENIKNRTFEVTHDLIINNQVKFNPNGMPAQIISFNEFMEDHLLDEMKVLNDRLIQKIR